MGHYLKTVGGPTENADQDHIFLLKANGSVVTPGRPPTAASSPSASGVHERPGGAGRLDPGAPRSCSRSGSMKDVKDITQILYQIAVSVGVLIAGVLMATMEETGSGE